MEEIKKIESTCVSLALQLEHIGEDICDNYCRYPLVSGKAEDWLIEDPESPCFKCPVYLYL